MSFSSEIIVPMLPYFLILILVIWSLVKKEKWFISAFLSLSFSCAPLLFVFVGEDAIKYGNFQVGFAIGKYASIVATIPFAVFGWYLGRKLSFRTAFVVATIGFISNFGVVKVYQYLIKRNSETLHKEVVLDCAKLPYHCAIRENKLDEIAKLKKAGFDINVRDFNSRSALWYGVNNAQAVKLLLESGADPDSFNIYGETPLAYSLVISLKPNLEIAKMLLAHGAQINRSVGFRKKINILNFAIVNKNLEVINFILENGADTQNLDGYRKTPCQRLVKFSPGEIKNLDKYCPQVPN